MALLLAACGTAGVAPTTVPPRPDLPPLHALTVEWDCGTGFWLSNPDQTAALHIRYLGEGAPAREVTLPDPGWQAQLVLGEELQANWCDDVLEPDEPVPQEHARHTVTAGTLVLVGEIPPRAAGGGGHSLTVEASDLEIGLPDGTLLPYGSVTITNAHWGLLAG